MLQFGTQERKKSLRIVCISTIQSSSNEVRVGSIIRSSITTSVLIKGFGYSFLATIRIRQMPIILVPTISNCDNFELLLSENRIHNFFLSEVYFTFLWFTAELQSPNYIDLDRGEN